MEQRFQQGKKPNEPEEEEQKGNEVIEVSSGSEYYVKIQYNLA